MTSYLMHRSPTIFPSPETFAPSRWLDAPTITAKGGVERPLSRYLVPFSKGPRMCLGINMANAELYIGLASVFRRLEFELFETGLRDVDMASDYLVPMPVEGSKGIRATVK